MDSHYKKIFAYILLLELFSFLPNAPAEQLCFFPSEVQGEYVMQNAAFNGNKFQYSTINITVDFFAPYGQCFLRNESNFVVAISTEDDRLTCFRCFTLRMVSKNVLLLFHTEPDINSKCSSTLETVKCPSVINEDGKDLYSIILFKTKEKEGPRRHEFCPFDSEMKFDYFQNEQKICDSFQSTISNCPSTASMTFDFSAGNCTQNLPTVKYDCIGSWNWNKKNHMVVSESSLNNTHEQKFKCGTYEYENDDIKLTMSEDCSSMRPKIGAKSKEIFQMRKKHFKKVDATSPIQFPAGMQGEWQFMTIRKGNIVYRDPNSFKTYSMTLIEKIQKNNFIVHSKSQCGEENYKCIAITQLSENVIETQVGSESSKLLLNYELCSGDNFDNKEWITQGRMDEKLVRVKCPISGRFFGRLPDDFNLCSEMTSDCQNPDILNYQVGPCDSRDIYETRKYRCVGHWTDVKSGNVYTFTQRDDIVSTFECFVGLLASEHENRIVIKEAGEDGNCYKAIDLKSFAMEMNQTEKCPHQHQNEKHPLEYDEIIVKPTLDDLSTKYEIFDDSNNEIHPTYKPKYDILSSNKKHHNRGDDDITSNEIPSSSSRIELNLLIFSLLISKLLCLR